MEVIQWIDENNLSPYLVNARLIKEWVEQQEKPHLPRRSRNIEGEEKELGKKLGNIRQDLIKPYMSLQTNEEKAEYEEKHPEIEEVIDIISELDIQCGNEKQKELAKLAREDLEKRRMLKEAKELESSYMVELSRVEDLNVENNTIETNLDEQ